MVTMRPVRYHEQPSQRARPNPRLHISAACSLRRDVFDAQRRSGHLGMTNPGGGFFSATPPPTPRRWVGRQTSRSRAEGCCHPPGAAPRPAVAAVPVSCRRSSAGQGDSAVLGRAYVPGPACALPPGVAVTHIP